MEEQGRYFGDVRAARAADDVLLIALLGEHDMTTAPTVEQAIAQGLEAGPNVIVDVSETAFLDSAILNVLLKGQRAASARGRRFVLQFGTTAIVRRVFESSDLLDRFVIRGSSDDAVSAARDPRRDDE